MQRKILLLYNTPKARRYFTALRRNIPELNLRVAGIGVRGGAALPAEFKREIAAYTMARKYVRERIPPWRLHHLQAIHDRFARWHFHAALARIRASRPDAIGVWGGQSIDVRAALRAAECLGIPHYTFECGLLPRTTTCDPRGVNADNSVPRDPAFYASYRGKVALPQTLLQRPSWQAREAVSELPERYLFVPFQMRLDSQVLLYSPWVRDMRHLFEIIAEAAREAVGDAVALVFKRHPSCRAPYRELRRAADALPNVMFADGNRAQELIDGSEGVITINSTVGIEALLRRRPVLTLGRACYAVSGVAGSARTVGQVAAWMRAVAAGQAPPAPHRDAFLRYLANEYCIPGHHKSPDEAHFAAIGERLSAHPGAVAPPIPLAERRRGLVSI
ncbi:MAG: capsular biosynthesis protein [Pseudomonadota bacterium]|nr:MAG: capsular biosynthesis protein [Pseudomonadota bacterium]